MPHYDVAVVGGGPSGSIAGLVLAEAGYDTVIFDRDTFPRKKLCGEFIAPDGHRVLDELNLIESLRDAGGSPVPAYDIISRQGDYLSDTFDVPGFALSRHRLDILLLQQAQSAGANVHTESKVVHVDANVDESDVPRHSLQIKPSGEGSRHGATAQLLVGAYGRRSSLDRKLDRPFFRDSSAYVGYQRHHLVKRDATMTSNAVKLYLIPGGYCGVMKIEGDLANVCLMVHGSSLPDEARTWSEIRQGLLSENPSLQRQLRKLTPAESGCRTVAQIPLEDKECARYPFLFTGDASGMVAPLTGSGQATALRSGKLLAELVRASGLPDHRDEFRQLAADWQRTWSSSFTNQIQFGRALNTLLQYDTITDLAVKVLKRTPAMSSALRRTVTSC